MGRNVTVDYTRGPLDKTTVPNGEYKVTPIDMIEETRPGGHVFHFMVFLITAPFKFAGALIHLCVRHNHYGENIPPR